MDGIDVTGYTYAVGTNRLDQSTGATAASYGYDASGNIATDSTDTTVYDLTDDQRLASVTKNNVTVGNYQYDGRGLRTVKTVNGENTLFIYCKSGKLIAEADSDGNITKEYVYLEGNIFAHFQYDVPVAAPEATVAVSESLPEAAPKPVVADNPPVVAEASIPSDTAFLQAVYLLLLMNDKSAEGAYYYINDHLGAPQIITDDSGSVVWKAEYLPFGKVNISVAQIENNLRFPGQYFDVETGLHYNWKQEGELMLIASIFKKITIYLIIVSLLTLSVGCSQKRNVDMHSTSADRNIAESTGSENKGSGESFINKKWVWIPLVSILGAAALFAAGNYLNERVPTEEQYEEMRRQSEEGQN